MTTSLCHQASQWLCSPGHTGLHPRVGIIPASSLCAWNAAKPHPGACAGVSQSWAHLARLSPAASHPSPCPRAPRAGLGQPPPQGGVFLGKCSIPVHGSSPHSGWGGLGSLAASDLGTPWSQAQQSPSVFPICDGPGSGDVLRAQLSPNPRAEHPGEQLPWCQAPPKARGHPTLQLSSTETPSKKSRNFKDLIFSPFFLSLFYFCSNNTKILDGLVA